MTMNGKSVIVTGGGGGIGQATAVLLGEAGCNVTIGDLNEAGCEETVAMIQKAGGQAQWIRTDVANESSVRMLVYQAVSAYGGLHGACNVAGIRSTTKLIADLTVEEWDRALRINLTSGFLSVKHQAPAIIASGGGGIVLVASTAAVSGFPQASEYCASKAGLLGLARAASCEYAAKGCRVNVVMPGATRTPMFTDSMADLASNSMEEYLVSTHPIGRIGQPSEIGAALRWLVSEEASFITGAVIAVDGGNSSI